MFNKKELINSIFYPRKSYKKKDSKDHLVRVSSDISIGVRFFIDNKNFNNILFFHGNAELAQEYDEIALFYHRHNCNFIVSDYRGYGLSSGRPDKDNLLSDSVKIFDYVEGFLNSKGIDGKMIVKGRSLGSASAWEISSRRIDRLDAVIIESGFATELPILKLMGVDPKLVDFNLSDGFEGLRKIRKYDKPLLVIHADRDHIIPLSEGKMTHDESLSKNKKIVVVESANHNNIIHCLGDRYFEDIEGFIDSI
ncbi:MAG: alpha/beta hydrolase [Candidatus Marinimicrobia bacterium]|nr:alpha/beta hydrolase [Candidatus Neomarinimicrobiota bacterium]|tara:strand:- start:591 stop:1346 length:756 start_codon:yes stop_codon:yes gene_type:complete